MKKTLALIHTSLVFITVETMIQGIIKELLPEVRVVNIVDDSLLADVIAEGKVSPEVTRRMCAYVAAAEVAGAHAVLSLCSSLGPTIDVARRLVKIPIIKIDDAMAQQAVDEASSVGILATVKTTLGPTEALIREKAQSKAKVVQVRQMLVAGAFEKLMGGDKQGHDDMVVKSARELSKDVDLLVLAQASMTRLALMLQDKTGLTVLSSPRMAVEHTKRVLDGLGNAG